MKVKYFGIYLFVFVLALPLPLKYSSISFIIMLINILILKTKKEDIKSVLKSPLFIVFLFFFLLDVFRALLTNSLENALVREVRIAFLVLPFLFIFKKSVIIEQYKNITSFFILGVISYIFIAWSYVGYYYFILHPTYIFEFSDHLLIYILAQEFFGAIHHTYIGMYITLSAMIIFINTFFNKIISMRNGVSLVLFLLINSFFIGGKISTALLILFLIIGLVLSLIKDTTFKKIKYYLVFFLIAIIFGVYSIKEWLSISLKSSFISRLSIYERNLQIIKDSFPFGIGKKQLDQTLLNELNIESGILIPHNIYFNELIVNGLLGIIILTSLLGYLCYVSIKNKSFIMGFFISIIILTGLVEDIFSRQRGILFFVFFAALYYINYSSRRRTESHTYK